MSSLEHPAMHKARPVGPSYSRTAMRLAAAALVACAVSACFRPLYGPTASGQPLGNVMASIQVEPVATAINEERIGHYLRSELIFDLDGSGQPPPKRYKLTTQVAQSLQTPIVDTASGRAISGTLIANVTYTLTLIEGSPPITQGVATASATYDRSTQRFATVRAARDAEIRVAKAISEQIKTRVAAALSAR